jgi:hypothetical protein
MLGDQRKNEWILIEEEFDEAVHFWNNDFLLTVSVSFKFFSAVNNLFAECSKILNNNLCDRDYETFCHLTEEIKMLFFSYFANNSAS